MLTLPILPEEIRIPLDKVEDAGEVICEYPGVTAVARPLDVETLSRWNDAFPKAQRSIAATTLVYDQLIRIEGLQMKVMGQLGAVPFDATNPLHKKSLPMSMRSGIYIGLLTRASVSEEQEKNSDSPSDSGGTTSTGSLPAEAAASANETSLLAV